MLSAPPRPTPLSAPLAVPLPDLAGPETAVLVTPRHALGSAEARLILDAVAAGQSVLLVSGDNRVDAYGLLALARRRGIEEAVAQDVSVARAFTVHQLASLLVDHLPRMTDETRADLVLVAGLLDLFLDEDVQPAEGLVLLRRVLRALPTVRARIVLTYPPPVTARAAVLAHLVDEAIPRRIDLPRPAQARIESYADPAAPAEAA